MVSIALLIGVLAQSPAAGQSAAQPPASPHAQAGATGAYVPQRVYDTRRKAFIDFEMMLADLARADVILVGEQHDDPNTHRLESAILQGLMRRGVPLTVSLEMFERDVQKPLDQYLAGAISEEDFLKATRPWPRYATDYRALIEMARGHGWRVVAANVPRRLAADVSKQGPAAFESASADDRPWMASELQCPQDDDYFKRFSEQMGGHPMSGTEAPKDAAAAAKAADEQRALVQRFYYAQCLKDETMAESIARAFATQEGRPGTIVHYTGAFHSDYGEGTAERVRRRLPGRRIATVSMVPTDNLDTLEPDDDDLKVADYLVFTIK